MAMRQHILRIRPSDSKRKQNVFLLCDRSQFHLERVFHKNRIELVAEASCGCCGSQIPAIAPYDQTVEIFITTRVYSSLPSTRWCKKALKFMRNANATMQERSSVHIRRQKKNVFAGSRAIFFRIQWETWQLENNEKQRSKTHEEKKWKSFFSCLYNVPYNTIHTYIWYIAAQMMQAIARMPSRSVADLARYGHIRFVRWLAHFNTITKAECRDEQGAPGAVQRRWLQQ